MSWEQNSAGGGLIFSAFITDADGIGVEDLADVLVSLYRIDHSGATLLVGEGPERSSAQALVRRLGLGSRVRFLGARRAAYGHMNGLISAAAVWDRALSADDITALYNSGNGAPLP